MKLVLFSHYGVGDLFESREFVRDWMRLVGVERAEYAHRKLPGFFADLPIDSAEVKPEMDQRARLTWLRDGKIIQKNGNCRLRADELWVNTWIGCGGDYVIWPGVGCVVENLYRMHNDYLREAGFPPLPRAMLDYLPVIDYSKVDLGVIPSWLEMVRGQRLVLVCNGKTGSGHANNFDMGEMLDYLPVVNGTLFLFTEKFPTQRPDVVFTDDLTRRHLQPVGAYGPCDFNAIGYLSQFCSVIVGRCSGAQMATQTRQNWMDASKTLVCFTEHLNGACFVRNPEALGLKMKRVWSPATHPATSAAVLLEVPV